MSKEKYGTTTRFRSTAEVFEALARAHERFGQPEAAASAQRASERAKMVTPVPCQDSDCTVGEAGCCIGCGVSRGDPCDDCGGHFYHTDDCGKVSP